MAVVAASLVVGLGTLAVTVLPAQVAGAATDMVNTCSGDVTVPGSLPYVVSHAASGDTVMFSSSLSCPPTSPITLSTSIAIGANITITGPGASTVAVSGNKSVNVFHVTDVTAASISGLTIEDGYYSGGDGGGIANDDSTLSVTNCTLSDNTGYFGGGIANEGGGTLTVTNSNLTDNTSGAGGGIYNYESTLTVTNSTLSANNGGAWGGGIANKEAMPSTVTGSTLSGNTSSTYGGGIWNYDSPLMVTGSILSDNIGPWGGGIDNESGSTLTVTGSTVSGNTSSSYGGGILSEATSLSVTASTISGNTVTGGDGLGGGILNKNPSTVTNSTLSGNSTTATDSEGGGIWNDSTLSVSNSTLSGNSAPGDLSGGGVYGPVALSATIVANSTSGGDCSGTITDDGYNLDDDGSCGFSAANHSQSDVAPKLGPLQNNGGPTETMALEAGSPAIGAVSSASLCSTPDQRGVTRPTPCDIGAYQSTGPAPTIAKVKPARGKPGKKVTIKGTNLSGATAVKFNGTAATIKTKAATQITTTVPAGATTGLISVTTPGGTVTSTKRFKVT